MQRVRLALALAVITSLAATTFFGFAPASAAAKSTVVTYVNPVASSSHLIKHGYRITHRRSGGDCVGSETVDGAGRCFSGNYVFDPCWPFRFHDSDFSGFVCLAQPWSKSLTYLRLASSEGFRTHGHTLWGLQLMNGARCSALSGAVDSYRGQFYRFGCSDGRNLIGGIDARHRLWRVKAVSNHHGKRSAAIAKVTQAWFGYGESGR